MKTIAVIDDDINIGNMLQELLSSSGYNVLRAYSGTEALLLLSSQSADLILLDLMLPGLSGEEILSKICSVPVIVISAKADVNDKVELLMSGAADYLTKPFDTNELLARIAAQLRSAGLQKGGDGRLSFHGLELMTETRTVMVNGEKIHLTKTEFAILKQLMKNPHQVITKSQLLDLISEDTADCLDENSLKVHISNMRKKLRETGGMDYIESVWGIGFKMRDL